MTQTTTLNRQWLVRIGIFFVVLLVFGIWGLFDALIVYPGRARRFAEYQEWQYLTVAEQQGQLGSPLLGADDPAAELARLTGIKGQLRPLEKAKREWLAALGVFGAGLLKPENARIENGRERLAQLSTTWTGTNPPKPLAAYDIPVQWVFVAVGLGGALWIAALFVRARGHRYGWDPEEKRLYLPGGATLVPTDVAEYDRRKWDKFLMFLKVHEGHAALGGREIKLDLLRHHPLEQWVVQMETTAFPERAADAKGEDRGEDKPSDPPPAEGDGAGETAMASDRATA